MHYHQHFSKNSKNKTISSNKGDQVVWKTMHVVIIGDDSGTQECVYLPLVVTHLTHHEEAAKAWFLGHTSVTLQGNSMFFWMFATKK